MHECVLSGLEAGVTYYYRVGDPSSPDSLSAVFSFRAGPVATWAVYGDLGTQFMYKSLQTLLRDSAAGAFSGVVHVGDVAYDLSWFEREYLRWEADRWRTGQPFDRTILALWQETHGDVPNIAGVFAEVIAHP